MSSPCCDDSYGWPEMVDAKLTTKQRKSMKGSTFCGPGRSFPVPDCAHVTAARRLIGRAKVSSSTKSKILACVSRKAKQLGCGGSKDSVNEEKMTALVESEVFDTTREVIAFLEAIEEEKMPEQKRLDDMKEKAVDTLIKLRSKRLGAEPSDDDYDKYMNRTLDSIFDSIEDELTYVGD